MAALALELSKVFEADSCGMGIANSQTLVLGRSVLPDATTEEQDTSRGDPVLGIQVDTDCFSLLARARTV